LLKVSSFFLLLIISVITEECLSHDSGLIKGMEPTHFLKPLESVVIRPELFLPELFLMNILKKFLILGNLSKNVLLLNLLEGVTGLWVIVKIF
jgi:hypothetical protein